jgi:integrase
VPLFLKSGSRLPERRGKALRPVTLDGMTRHLTGHYLKSLRKLPLDEITAAQINTAIGRIRYGADGRKPAPSAAWKIHWMLNSFFEWARETGKVGLDFVSPMGQVEEPPKGDPRTRYLDHDEIRLYWNACREWEREVLAEEAHVAAGGKRYTAGAPTYTDFPRIGMLLLLTGCRPQEIGDMRWSWIDLDAGELRIPREDYKTGNKFPKDATHIIFPLCGTAVDILRSVERKPGRDYVFGKVGNKGKTSTGKCLGCDLSHVRANIDRRIAGLGGARRVAKVGVAAADRDVEIRVREMLANGVPAYRIRSETHAGWHTIKEIKANVEAGEPIPEPAQVKAIPPWQLPDIRRTFRTQLGAVPGVSREIVERLIGHLIGNKIERVYDKYEYWAEKRAASDRWDSHVAAIIDGSVEKVVRPKFGQRRSA